ncbi:hypothetical protein V8G54_024166 [Vigna mungo]|uniref:Uncharacterized protein n=1 Tax=Vigna mungo TaxID=3915 RepID=A0AAQ3N4E5_VIGMU
MNLALVVAMTQLKGNRRTAFNVILFEPIIGCNSHVWRLRGWWFFLFRRKFGLFVTRPVSTQCLKRRERSVTRFALINKETNFGVNCGCCGGGDGVSVTLCCLDTVMIFNLLFVMTRLMRVRFPSLGQENQTICHVFFFALIGSGGGATGVRTGATGGGDPSGGGGGNNDDTRRGQKPHPFGAFALGYVALGRARIGVGIRIRI